MLMKVFTNGKIFTSNFDNEFVDTVIIIGNRIFKTGSYLSVKKYIYPEAEIIDLQENLMLPGFTDSHMHIEMGGFNLLSLDLSFANSRDEFRTLILDYIKTHHPKFIIGHGWRNYNWQGSEYPTIDWIDDITGELPVILYRMDSHMALTNSFSLKLAGVSSDTPDPEGGKFGRFDNGSLSGLLFDEAMNKIKHIFPQPDKTQKDKAVLAALQHANKHGITAIHDVCYYGQFQSLVELNAKDKLTCRVHARIPLSSIDKLDTLGFHGGVKSDKLQFGSLKDFADGSLGAGTAWFLEPYSDESNNYGLPTASVNERLMKTYAEKADEIGLQLSVHAIGDAANQFLINLFDALEKLNGSRDRRFRIEHGQHLNREIIDQLADRDIIISAQPYHLYDDGDWAEDKVGAERMNFAYPFRTLLDKSVRLAFGSDFPIVTLDPILGIYTAVTRDTKEGRYKEGLNPAEKISVTEAVRAYTIEGAYAGYNEKTQGSIEPGKFADFAILDQDIFTVPAEMIKRTKVKATIFDGELIYGKL